MKKLTLSVLSLIFLLCAAVGLVGCGKETHTHSFTEQKVEQQYLASEATCTESAKYYYSCSCGENGTQTFTYGNALGHSFTNYVSDNNATCTRDGTITATCNHSGCNEKNTITIENSKLGHSFTDYVPDGNATCTQDGTKTAKCDYCDATDTVTDEGSKLSHTFDKQVVSYKYLAWEATCTEPAKYYYSCACGENDTETFTYGNALGHSFTNYVSDNNATCTKDGTITATCNHSGCNEKNTITIANSRLRHSFTDYIPDGNATCTKDGTKTATCDHIGCTENNTIADANSKLGHSFTDYVSDGNATCTEDGTKTAKCDRCNATDTVTDEGSKLSHTFDKQVVSYKYLAWEATCTNPAKYYYSCVCGENGTETFTYGNALGHSFTNYVSDDNATCTKDGTKTATCNHSGCNENNTIVDENSKLGHKFTNYISDGNATCTQDGTKTAKCDRCNATDTVTDEGSAKGHSYSSQWEYNDTYHWQNSICGHEVKGNYAMHTTDESGFCTICDQPLQATEGVIYDVSSGEYAEVIDYTGTSKRINIADTYNSLPVQSIYNEAFKGKDITYVIIPSSVKNIGVSAFEGCGSLTRIVIPDSVTSIGVQAFSNCSRLTSITIPDGVTSIDNSAFKGCHRLTNIIIPDSVTSIGISAFEWCSSLMRIVIPDSVTFIGDYAFSSCSGLTSVTIPDSVTSIGFSAFYNCSGLTSITIPDSVTSIGQLAFAHCSGLTSIEFKGTKAQWNAIVKESDWNSNIGKYTVYCTDGTIE